MTGDCMVIESVETKDGSTAIRITFGSETDNYICLNARDAERQFRDEHGLKGKRIHKVCT